MIAVHIKIMSNNQSKKDLRPNFVQLIVPTLFACLNLEMVYSYSYYGTLFEHAGGKKQNLNKKRTVQKRCLAQLYRWHAASPIKLFRMLAHFRCS